MKHEEIIEMAEKCGFYEWRIKTPQDLLNIISFAKMVAKKEREACAKVCDDIHAEHEAKDSFSSYAEAIRARGEA